MMYYSAYGFNYASDFEFPLPKLPKPDHVDFRLIRKPVAEADSSWQEAGWGITAEPGKIRIYWDVFGCFEIEKGRVYVNPGDEISDERLGYFLLGDISACLMTLEGQLLLHSAAVQHNGQAMAFLGASGQGKSTTITLLQEKAGCDFVSDDLVRVELRDGKPFIHPAPQRVKLLPESIEELQLETKELNQLFHGHSKKAYTPKSAAPEPIPLKTICFINVEDDIKLRDCADRDSLLGIIYHSYTGQIHRCYQYDIIANTGMNKVFFESCTALNQSVHKKVLCRSRHFDLDKLLETLMPEIECL